MYEKIEIRRTVPGSVDSKLTSTCHIQLNVTLTNPLTLSHRFVQLNQLTHYRHVRPAMLNCCCCCDLSNCWYRNYSIAQHVRHCERDIQVLRTLQRDRKLTAVTRNLFRGRGWGRFLPSLPSLFFHSVSTPFYFAFLLPWSVKSR